MVAKNLVIVESPAKAKTIEKFLGKDFMVKSSFGHIRDLPSKKMGVDIESGEFTPEYEITEDKKKVVSELKREAKGKDVWLASDEDREGEAIAWHVCHALKVDPKKTKRIVFHEITKPAITKAIESPRTVNQDLVDAQQARRVLDRLVGYELSPVLWKKIQRGLSAGRVQSVSVRIIVEREREIESFTPKTQLKISSEFLSKKEEKFGAELKTKFKTVESAHSFLESIADSSFSVRSLEKKPGKKSSPAPFTTSTLQQEASRKMGFSVKQTMIAAQKLYEAGKITYMRTDSVNISEEAIKASSAIIIEKYGEKFSAPTRYKTKSKDAQEAHEAIRPTDFSTQTLNGTSSESRLYGLIYKRTLASQMADAQIEKTIAEIEISGSEEYFVASGEMISFSGFLEVYIEGRDEEEAEKGMLPTLAEGESVLPEKIYGRETFSRPPARYTEASLVKKLEEEGIGRPSTYAPTISTIQNRGYVEKSDREGRQRTYAYLELKDKKILSEKRTETTGTEKNKLFPTSLGEVVNDFLVAHFADVVDLGFTREAEASFDEVATGKQAWNAVIKKFYGEFHKTVEKADDIKREDTGGIREVGVHPKTKKMIYARLGRFGPMLQMGETGDKKTDPKPAFASIPAGKDFKTITLEESLELLSLPRTIGTDKNSEEILANIGRFGPYVQRAKLYASIPKDAEFDVFSVDLKTAIQLLDEKEKAAKNRIVGTWEDDKIQLLRGPFGIYIKSDGKNYRIPKEQKEDAEKLKLPAIKKIIAEGKPSGKGRKKFTKKK